MDRYSRIGRHASWIAPLALVASLGACSKDGRTRADTAAGTVAANADTAAAHADTAMHAAGDSVTAATRSGWTDASILGFAATANRGEIEEGQLAAKKATNAAVKAFAREIMADHRAMLAEGKSLGTKINVTPDTTHGDVRDLADHTRDDLKDLTDKAAGADWDKEFIDHEIDGHQKVLDKLQDAAKKTTNADLRAAIEKATGKVQQHLTKAQDIKANKLRS